MPETFLIDEIDDVVAAFHAAKGNPDNPEWDKYRGRALKLPDWCDRGIDPASPEFVDMQEQLWRAVTGRDRAYDPVQDEQTPETADYDAVRRPGFYTATPRMAGDQLIALGHILKQSGLSAGQYVIEYGAGFGQISLALARLGVNVRTVDISPQFTKAVQQQAEFFGVPLASYVEKFGFNPEPGRKYDLILFYEAFHHCRDFFGMVQRLKDLLAPNGHVFLAGEPIGGPHTCGLTFPWGIRLDCESVAVMRIRGWFEMGFHEDYLLSTFARYGFKHAIHDASSVCHWAKIYDFHL